MKELRTGLIGAHIGRSRLSAALKIMCDDNDLAFEFTPIDTAERVGFDFARTVDDLREIGWSGVTVTHPHKAQAATYAGEAMDREVRDLGASNTLTFNPELVGHNTDFTGFLDAWRNAMGKEKPGNVAVAGAGGVARAIVPALLKLGASEIRVWDTAPEAAARFAADLGSGVTAVDVSEGQDAILCSDGLVNATPIGMTNYPGTVFPSDLLGSQTWCFDAVYTPTDTAFLMNATAKGLIGISGFDLFRFMALRSFTAYTGISPDPETTLPKLNQLRPVGSA